LSLLDSRLAKAVANEFIASTYVSQEPAISQRFAPAQLVDDDQLWRITLGRQRFSSFPTHVAVQVLNPTGGGFARKLANLSIGPNFGGLSHHRPMRSGLPAVSPSRQTSARNFPLASAKP
jgi:hypothetical protein